MEELVKHINSQSFVWDGDDPVIKYISRKIKLYQISTTKNRRKFIEKTCDKILEQTGKDYSYLTPQILAEFADETELANSGVIITAKQASEITRNRFDELEDIDYSGLSFAKICALTAIRHAINSGQNQTIISIGIESDIDNIAEKDIPELKLWLNNLGYKVCYSAYEIRIRWRRLFLK